MRDETFPALPKLLAFAAAPAPFSPLGPVLTRALRDLARRRPDLFERLGPHGKLAFLIVATDLALAFRMVPDGPSTRVTVTRRLEDGSADVTISGPLLALLSLVDGTADGDALFFNRVISIAGRTEAVLALRNAIEEAELAPADLLGIQGRAGELADNTVPILLRTLRDLASAWQGRRPA